MTRKSITRVAASAVATGFASVALAMPASAVQAPDPDLGGLVSTGGGAASTSQETPWMELGLGALGGLALAGAGVAAVAGMRHRHAVPTA